LNQLQNVTRKLKRVRDLRPRSATASRPREDAGGRGAYSGDGWRESRGYSPVEATKQILLDLQDCGETISDTGQTLIAELA
jgi:hypothetical protein